MKQQKRIKTFNTTTKEEGQQLLNKIESSSLCLE